MISSRVRGYTLIELIVSVAIFSIIMLLATSAYLSLINYSRYARAESILMTNLAYAVDEMSRSIRTGTLYQCNGGGDCSGGTSFTFRDDTNTTITYVKDGGALIRCVNHSVGCSASTGTAVTDPAITLSSLLFYVRGTGAGDSNQPTVLMTLKGQAAVQQSAPVSFSFQTSATERLIDL